MDNWSDHLENLQKSGIKTDFLFNPNLVQSSPTSRDSTVRPVSVPSVTEPHHSLFAIKEEAIQLKTLAAISAQEDEFELAIAYASDAAIRFQNLKQPFDRLECLFLIGQFCINIEDFVRGYVSFNNLLIASQAEKQLIFQAHAILGLGKIHLGRGALHKAKNAFAKVHELLTEHQEQFSNSTYHIDPAEPVFLLAQTALFLEEYGEAIQYGNQATELCGYNSLLRCYARLTVATAYIKIGKLARATTLLINNLSFLKGNTKSPLLIETHKIYADLLFQQQNASKAKSHYLKGLTLAEKGNNQELTTQFHYSLSKLYKAESDFEKALYHFETFYQMSEKPAQNRFFRIPKLYP